MGVEHTNTLQVCPECSSAPVVVHVKGVDSALVVLVMVVFACASFALGSRRGGGSGVNTNPPPVDGPPETRQ